MKDKKIKSQKFKRSKNDRDQGSKGVGGFRLVADALSRLSDLQSGSQNIQTENRGQKRGQKRGQNRVLDPYKLLFVTIPPTAHV